MMHDTTPIYLDSRISIPRCGLSCQDKDLGDQDWADDLRLKTYFFGTPDSSPPSYIPQDAVTFAKFPPFIYFTVMLSLIIPARELILATRWISLV